MSEEEQHHETPSIRSVTSLTNSSPGTTRIVQGMISDILSQHDRIKKSNLKKLHKIGDYEFGDLDYQQIEIWAKEYNLTPEEIILRFTVYKKSSHWDYRFFLSSDWELISGNLPQVSDKYNYPEFGREEEFQLIVNDGRITTLPWDISLLDPKKATFLESLATETLILYDGSRWSGGGYEERFQFNEGPGKYKIRPIPDADLTVSLSNLRRLWIENIPINCLTVLGCPKLSYLFCDALDLKELKIAGLKHLESLSCDENHFDQLDLSDLPQLSKLSCRDGSIEKLDTKNIPNLTELCCSMNYGIKQLDLRNNPHLKILKCAFTRLKKLDISNLVDLRILDCRANPLKEIDITHNQKLEYLLCNPEVKIKKTQEQLPLIISECFITECFTTLSN